MSTKAVLGIAIAALLGAQAAAAATYEVAQRIPVGGDGGWDYPSVDPAAGMLYLSRATHVAVVDTQSGKVVGEIGDTPGVHGIALAPDLGRGYVSAGKADAVKVFDLKTRAVLASIPVGAKPDAIVYEPVTHQTFAFNGHGDSVSIIDTATNRVTETVALGGGPEFARADGKGRVFVNIEDKNQLVALDAASRRISGRWTLAHCEGPTGLALDAVHQRSFSVCANAMMTVLDTATGGVVATLPIGNGVDGVEFDPETANAFSANGDGTLTVVHEIDAGHFAVAQTLPTAPGARTIALDPRTHALYLPTADFGTGKQPPGTAPPKSAAIPGTFFVLVVAPAPAKTASLTR